MSPEENSAWNALPATKEFRERLVLEAANAARTEHDLLWSDSIGQARVACGYRDALERVLMLMADRDTAMPDLKDNTFVDSATRPSTLRGKK